jgi:hypothetical protein
MVYQFYLTRKRVVAQSHAVSAPPNAKLTSIDNTNNYSFRVTWERGKT